MERWPVPEVQIVAQRNVYDDNDNNNNNNKFIFCNYQCKNLQIIALQYKGQKVKKKISRLAIIGHYSDKKLKHQGLC